MPGLIYLMLEDMRRDGMTVSSVYTSGEQFECLHGSFEWTSSGEQGYAQFEAPDHSVVMIPGDKITTIKTRPESWEYVFDWAVSNLSGQRPEGVLYRSCPKKGISHEVAHQFSLESGIEELKRLLSEEIVPSEYCISYINLEARWMNYISTDPDIEDYYNIIFRA